ncbi:MAG: pyridoxal-dependent decarboxylase [Anaerolineae bacterium]
MDHQEQLGQQDLTLDPEDWGGLRELGHKMLDDMFDYMQGRRESPAWQPIPDEVKERLTVPVPQEPQAAEAVYDEFLRDILPYQMGTTHPRFWGWVIGTGTPMGVLAEMLAATVNPNLGGGDHVANYVEAQVIEWCKQMLGFPAEASGVLVSGGSTANLIGLTVARNAYDGFDMRQKGLHGTTHQMVVYGSNQMHSSIQRAVELLGLGNEALRLIPVNDAFQIDIAALQAAITADKAAGHIPLAVVGNAGTVNTAAFDDLSALADLCEREGLWFHVDGAFGALAALAPELRSLTAGMERADSLAFDMHKWMYIPFDVACTLVRDRKAHYRAFTLTPDYLRHMERGAGAGSHWFSDYSLELSRSFRALKVWMSIKNYGIEKCGQLIYQNVQQAHYLTQLIEAEPQLELLAPTSCNIVCFRFCTAGLTDDALNELNEELLIRLHETGTAVPSYTRIDGKFAIRVAITNHRSRLEDFELLARSVVEFGQALLAEKSH